MNSRELVLRAISFEKVPRVPTAVLDGQAFIAAQNNLTPQQTQMMDDQEFVDLLIREYDAIGSDLVYTSAGYYGAMHDVVGKLCGVESPDPAKPVAPDPDDVLALKANDIITAMDSHPAVQSTRRRIEAMNRAVGEEKLIMAFSIGPLTTAGMFLGMENLMTSMLEEPETVRKAMDLGIEISKFVVDDEVEHGSTAISTADPSSSSELISSDSFRDLALPALKVQTSAFAKHGLPVMLHICGDSTARLEDICDLDIDIFSLDGGDLSHELEVSRGHYAIFGNLNTVSVMKDADADTVARKSRELCEIAGLDGGFILAPGCDLPPATPRENVIAMTGAARG
jgi:uroporphyrinogen decarboxylase